MSLNQFKSSKPYDDIYDIKKMHRTIKNVFMGAKRLLPTWDKRFMRYIEEYSGCSIKDVVFGDVVESSRYDSYILNTYGCVSIYMVCRDNTYRVDLRKTQFAFQPIDGLNIVISFRSVDVKTVSGDM